ncbi:MAG TPA: AI-2E family transporter [Candidatus Jorgensenbacteria bacterium]|nr:AI-2E family transporter [Candidatus Jorgensenbacteria bacterium]
MKMIRIEIGWNTIWQILVLVGMLLLLYVAREALGILFVGVIFSLGLDPAVTFLEKRGVHRIIGTILVFLILLLFFATAMFFIIPTAITEAGDFIVYFNDTFSQFFGIGIPEAAIQDINTSLNRAISFITSSNISLGGAISNVFKTIILVVSAIVISFYLSIEKNGPERLLRMVLPQIYEKTALEVFKRFKNKVRHWLLAQLGLSLVIGIIVSVGLWLLGVEYALTLGLLAAVFELVPVIGPIIAGSVALLISLSESFSLALYVLIFFFLVQQLENNILVPLVYRKLARVHPIMVLVALLAGGQAAGFFGMLLAVPIAILVQEVFSYIAERKARDTGLGI